MEFPATMSTKHNCSHFDFLILEMPDMCPLSTSVFFPWALEIEKDSEATILTERACDLARMKAGKVGTYWENQTIEGRNCHM